MKIYGIIKKNHYIAIVIFIVQCNMIKSNTPIELIDELSEHTIKSLNKNQIFFVKDLFPYKDNIYRLTKLKWIWENTIKELKKTFYGAKSLKRLQWNINIKEDDNPNLSPFFVFNNWNYYLDSLCYIIFSNKRLKNQFLKNHITFFDLIGNENFSTTKRLWKISIKEVNKTKYEILDYYWINNSKKLSKLYNYYSLGEKPFQQVDSLNLKDFILNFYNNLLEIEKNIILSRENWFKNSTFSRLNELGKINDMKWERIRQYWVLINSDYDSYLQYHSHYFEKYIENLLKLRDDFEIRKFSEIEEFSQFSYEFIANTLSKIVSSNYLFHKNNFSNTLFFLRKSKIWKTKKFKLFDVIDNFFYKERKIDEILTLDNIIRLWLWNNTDRKTVDKFKPIVRSYLEHGFSLKTDSLKITFPLNKKDYPSLIINELALCDKPIHYSKLYNKLKIKYPQYSWKKSTVHGVLVSNSDAVNVWLWLYIHISERPNWSRTITEIIENYLEETEDKYDNIDNIIKHVKKQKIVSEKSIKYYLNNKNKFIRIWMWIYWLTKYWKWKVISLEKPDSIIDIVEKYLEYTEDKCATIDDIIKHVKWKKAASEKSIIWLVWDWKRNRKKFIRIWTWIFGLTKYRKWKSIPQTSKISEPNTKIKSLSIADIVEKYLEWLENHYASTEEIVKHVKNQKLISEKSIKEYIRSKSKNKNKLIHLWTSIYWLTKYRKWEANLETSKISWIKRENTVDAIEKYLEKTKNKCASTEDIIKYIKKHKKVSEETIRFCLFNKKKNGNKFSYIWKLTYWLTSYWSWKLLSWAETISNIIEKYLEDKKDKCASTEDIIKHVQSQKEVSKKSIIIYLTERKRNENKFINIWKWTYWLTSYREWKIIK